MRNIGAIILILLVSCTSSPLDRRQVVLYSDAEMSEQGIRAYRQMQSELPATTNNREFQYVQCVANHVVAALDQHDQDRFEWEVTVFDDEQANAFQKRVQRKGFEVV